MIQDVCKGRVETHPEAFVQFECFANACVYHRVGVGEEAATLTKRQVVHTGEQETVAADARSVAAIRPEVEPVIDCGEAVGAAAVALLAAEWPPLRMQPPGA